MNMNAASGLVSDAHYRVTIHWCMVFEKNMRGLAVVIRNLISAVQMWRELNTSVFKQQMR
jgi:hypothetical protein